MTNSVDTSVASRRGRIALRAVPGRALTWPRSSNGRYLPWVACSSLLPGNGTDIVPVPQAPEPAPPADQSPATPSVGRNDPTTNAPTTPATNGPQGPAPTVTAEQPTPAANSPAAGSESPAPTMVEQDPDTGDDDNRTTVPALALASGALLVASRPRQFKRTNVSQYSLNLSELPGTPIPSDPATPGVSSAFGTSRIIPGQGVTTGFVDPDMTSPLGQKWGAPITIDPSTPGATGPYSGNLITPDPLSGDSSVALPGFNQGVGGTRAPGSINIDAVKGAKLRIVEAQPISLSTVNYGGLPELVVNYQFTYQVQYTYTFVGNAIVYSTEWSDVSLADVAALQGMGVTVPKIN